MPKSLTALVWKEWRQQRSVVAAGVAVAVMLPALAYAVAISADDRVYLLDFAELVPFLMAIFVWPLFAAIVGATTNGVPPVRLVQGPRRLHGLGRPGGLPGHRHRRRRDSRRQSGGKQVATC